MYIHFEKGGAWRSMKQKIVILALLVVFAAGIAAFTLVYDRAVFDGSRIANSDSCRLDIARMTGSDRHTLELNAGDTLQVQRSAS